MREVDVGQLCFVLTGYLRDFSAILPVMSHAYNFQENAYGFKDTSRPADNAASEADAAVDPTLQVNRNSQCLKLKVSFVGIDGCVSMQHGSCIRCCSQLCFQRLC